MNNKKYTIGVDIGGTKMSAVLFDGHNVLADYSLATPKDDLKKFLIMIKALIDPLLDKAKKEKIKVGGAGLGLAGFLDYEEGKIIKSPNLPFLDGQDILGKIKKIVSLPVYFDNDANCFTRAEAVLGAGKKYQNVFGVTIGTGIGGGWCVNGEIYRGAHVSAGEIGWVVVDYDNGIRLEEAYQKLMQNNPIQVAEEAYRGDVLAEKAYQEFGQYLGASLVSMINLIDPEIIVLGGGVVKSTDLFLSDIKKEIKKYALAGGTVDVKVVKGKLGDLAGAIGAAMLV
jgi:glucokinase